MPSPRTRRHAFAVPREIVDASLEAHRSHLYPVSTPAAAYGRMASGQLAYEHWLPQKMGQQQWLKDSDYGYPPQYGAAEGFAMVLGQSPALLQQSRLEEKPYPQMPWHVVAQELVDAADWGGPGEPTGRHPLARGVPYPQSSWPSRGMPEEMLAQFQDEPHYSSPPWVTHRDAARARAEAEIRQLEAEYAPFTWEGDW